MDEVIIHDGNYHLFLNPVIDGELCGTGLMPRDFIESPLGSCDAARPFALPSIADPEKRLADLIGARAQLSDARMRGNFGRPIPSRDQGQSSFCWAHSTVGALLLARARQNLPYADLSAYAIACIIKNFQNMGGYGLQSLKWVAEFGCPTSDLWPQKSMNHANVNPLMFANALNNRIAQWYDLEPRNKSQLITCLLLGIPVVCDFHWWGHSVVASDLVSLNPFRIRIWNSWGDKWSKMGMGILEGAKAIPDAMCAPAIITASIL